MEPLILIAGMALLLALVFFVGYPFFASRQQGPLRSASTRSRQLQERKEQLYAAIKEVEFDQQLGKLSDEDYRRLRAQLEEEALGLIQQLDRLNGREHATAADLEFLNGRVEQAVRARRQALTGTPADPCPSCGAERRPGDLFCPRCGTAFAADEPSS